MMSLRMSPRTKVWQNTGKFMTKKMVVSMFTSEAKWMWHARLASNDERFRLSCAMRADAFMRAARIVKFST